MTSKVELCIENTDTFHVQYEFLSIHRTRHDRNHGVWNSKGAILLIGEIIHLSFLQVIIFHDFFSHVPCMPDPANYSKGSTHKPFILLYEAEEIFTFNP